MDEQPRAMGFPGIDGVLYCSRACALSHGTDGNDVDQEEYEGLLEGEASHSGSVCPVCGAEFPVAWQGHDPD